MNRSLELAQVLQFVRSDTDPSWMIICGEEGIGKTTLLRGVFEEYQENSPKDVIAFFTYRGLNSLTVEAVNLEQEMWQALKQADQGDVYHNVGSFLAYKLYGNLDIQYEKPIGAGKVGSETSEKPFLRRTFESYFQNRQADILQTFTQWIREVSKSIPYDHKIVLLVDVQKAVPAEELVEFFRMVVNGANRKLRVVFAVEDSISDIVLDSQEIRRHVRTNILRLLPFARDQVVAIMSSELPDCTTASELVDSLVKNCGGNPLRIHLACKLVDPTDLRDWLENHCSFSSYLSSQSLVNDQLQSILAFAPEPIPVKFIENMLYATEHEVKALATSSPLVAVVDDPVTHKEYVHVIHPLLAETIRKEVPESQRRLICYELSKYFEPDINGLLSDYEFYAAYPQRLVFRLQLLREAHSIDYVDLFARSTTRILFRQWAASKLSRCHIETSMSEYRNELSVPQKAILIGELGYFSHLEGDTDQAQILYDQSLRLLTTDQGRSSTSNVDPAELLNMLEALVEKADFHRKRREYDQSLHDLKLARDYYDLLLEMIPASIPTIETNLARVTHNCGIVYRDHGVEIRDSEKERSRKLLTLAIDCFREALAIETTHGNLGGQIGALSQLAIVNGYLGHDDVVGTVFARVRHLSEESGNMLSWANLAGNLASIYLSLSHETNTLRRARSYAELSFAAFEKLGIRQEQFKAKSLLHEVENLLATRVE